MDYFNILPEEITLEILTRLPTESVLDSKLVCINWRNHVSYHPSFFKMHCHHLDHPFDSADGDDSSKLGFIAFTVRGKFHYFEYDENHEATTKPIQRIRRMKITSPFGNALSVLVGSCNGLICLAQHVSICICNPITREYVILPLIDTYCLPGYLMNGFGYVSSTNDYKVVRIYVLNTFAQVYIYTLGSGSGWRNLGKFNFEFYPVNWYEVGIFANGADLYFYCQDSKLGMIATFDLAKEKFREHLSPPSLPAGIRWYDTRIGVSNGFLYFSVVGPYINPWVRFDIWLKKKNGIDDMKEAEEHQSLIWSKEFTVENRRLLAVTKRDGVLSYGDYYINIYDTRTSTSKRLVKFKNLFTQVSPHKNTLVSLKQLGEEDTKVMESVETEEAKGREQLQEDENPEYIYI